MSDYTPKVGDRVRIVIEAEVAATGPTYFDTRENTFAKGQPDIVSIEKIKPPVKVFGPGDIVRQKSRPLYTYALGPDGYTPLYGDFMYTEYSRDGYMVGPDFFTSDIYEKVEVPA